jgi:hypothetical protein
VIDVAKNATSLITEAEQRQMMAKRIKRTLYVPPAGNKNARLMTPWSRMGLTFSASGQRSQWTIGAGSSCDIVIDAETVSGCHAVLVAEWNNGSYQWYICDSGSTNGTGIRDTWLQPNLMYRLENGETIWLGRSISVRLYTR